MTLRIITLASDSPLAENGVEDGDYISQVNGTEISTRDELRLIYKEPAVEFKIQRGSKKFTVQLSTDEPGATVEDGEGEFFALLPQDAYFEAVQAMRSLGIPQTDAQKPDELVAFAGRQ